MKYNKEVHHRRSIRLKDYDYSQTGAYFITICAHNRECLFGEIVNGEMRLNGFGRVAEACWLEIPKHFSDAELDEFIIMPNHIHGIVIIGDVGTRHAVSLQIEQFGKPTRNSIPTIIRSYKSAVTNKINQIRHMPGIPVWQRNYYEHIIRKEGELNSIREYIRYNPLKWNEDEENPSKK